MAIRVVTIRQPDVTRWSWHHSLKDWEDRDGKISQAEIQITCSIYSGKNRVWQ